MHKQPLLRPGTNADPSVVKPEPPPMPPLGRGPIIIVSMVGESLKVRGYSHRDMDGGNCAGAVIVAEHMTPMGRCEKCGAKFRVTIAVDVTPYTQGDLHVR